MILAVSYIERAILLLNLILISKHLVASFGVGTSNMDARLLQYSAMLSTISLWIRLLASWDIQMRAVFNNCQMFWLVSESRGDDSMQGMFSCKGTTNKYEQNMYFRFQILTSWEARIF